MSCLWRNSKTTRTTRSQNKSKSRERIVIEKRVCFDYVTNKAEDERKREKEIKIEKRIGKNDNDNVVGF